ncbi:ABC transporter substrate-binding protein [Streptomyces sp. HB2AG]|uniref:ABC transporter substrate-binding protein n=1 Tax=Streptomyces sp. HB2AG TaxID=2983400 RepID=UPI0022AAD702|nr:ABC transporter substrate-binding protein [Streptomyces sp. HB2AG]MCZ2527834.1 ABC transporter substrate-binding protein [Streptomyces sp. HB2AG]
MTARTGRGLAATAAAGAILAATAACSVPGSGGGNGDGGSGDGGRGGSGNGDGTSLVVGIAQEPETLNPLLGYGKDGNSKIFDGLLTHDAGMKLRPALAEELPDVSDDGRTYTYRLREGVEFSDGEELTAEDVVFTYETILDEGTNNPSKGELDAVADVRAKDDRTVVFRLKYPYAPFAERTVLPIVPEHAAGKGDVNTGPFNSAPIGTGPYVLTGWSRGEKLTLKANPDHWGGAPKVERLTMAVVEDDDVRATRLRSGDLDAAVLPPALAAGFEDDEGRRRIDARTADYRAVTLPTGNKVTGDTAVRRALDTAVDRDAMVDGILDGAGRAAHGPIPVHSPWFAEGTERPHDPAKARKILDEAGWKPGEDGIRTKDGRRASFTLWYFSGDKLRQDHALAYASDAKKIGIEVKVQAGTRETVRSRLGKDAMLMGNGFPADPDFDLYGLLHSSLAGDGWNNMSRYASDEVDEALDEGRRSNDPKTRGKAYDRVQRALVKNPGYTFLTHIDHVYVMDDDWDGVTTQLEPHDHGLGTGPWWNVEDWTPKK